MWDPSAQLNFFRELNIKGRNLNVFLKGIVAFSFLFAALKPASVFVCSLAAKVEENGGIMITIPYLPF